MSCRFDDSYQARPGWSWLKDVFKPTWHILVPNVQWKTPDDGQRNCLKHVEFLDKNKFEKIIALVYVIKLAWHILVPNVQWKTPDDGQRKCPKHVEFVDKNKFGKIIALVYVIKPAWHTPVPNVQWKTPDDGQRKCPKHVEFLDKNKFGKIIASVGFMKRKLRSVWKKMVQIYKKKSSSENKSLSTQSVFPSMADGE